MKKFQFTLLFPLTFLSLGSLFSLPNIDIEAQNDARVIFRYVHESAPFFKHQVENLKKSDQGNKEVLADQQKKLLLCEVIDIIASQDIESLSKLAPSSLIFDNVPITVPGNKFKDDFQGRCIARMIEAENALGFVLFHSLLDSSDEQEQKTLQLLRVCFEKGLDFNTKFSFVYWVKNNKEDKGAFDYVSILTLDEMVRNDCSSKVQLLVKEYVPKFEIKG